MSELLEESYVVELYNLENCPEEDRRVHFIDGIFNRWGVDGFAAALNYRDNTKEYYYEDRILFVNYLENLLTAWKTPGNFETFAKSTDFVKALIREGNLWLEILSCIDERELQKYLSLLMVVFCLFETDKKIYDEINLTVDPSFEKPLNQLKQEIKADYLHFLDSSSLETT
ncbi:unnamed protein product, partial [Allacma fusca]